MSAARDQLLRCAGTGVRPGPRGGGPLAPDRDPAPDERRVSPGGEAQLGDLPVAGGVRPALAEAERGAAHSASRSARPAAAWASSATAAVSCSAVSQAWACRAAA